MTHLTSSIELPVHGMSCASCAARVERALRQVSGVMSVSVNLTTNTAYLEATASLESQDLINTVQKAGFTVPSKSTELTVTGMSCASCSARVERALRKIPGVLDATVNVTTESATITGYVTSHILIDSVTKSGFSAHLPSAHTSLQNDPQEVNAQHHRQLLKNVVTSVILWGMIASLAMLHPLEHSVGKHIEDILQFAFASLLLLFPGRRFYQKGIPALLRLTPEMNSLVAMGSLAAFLYSTIVVFIPRLVPHHAVNLYFEAASGIITLVLIGRFLESYAKDRTSEALRGLTHLQPRTAHVLRQDTFITLPVDAIHHHDSIEIRPGERIPLDGQIYEGESYVDESMITGESTPVLKKAGDHVIGGTINQHGSLRFHVTAIGNETTLAHIIKLVEHAQGTKLPIQSLVNTVTLWFVPTIIALSTLTFIGWYFFGPSPSFSFALVNAIAVLIAACPCAMGLATPTAIMVGTGKGAELGILFRKGAALQQLEKTRVIALDKTGTLTQGTPTLTDLILRPGIERSDLLRYLASVEVQSEHPIGQAILNAAHTEQLDLFDISNFKALPGMGVTAHCQHMTVHLGSQHYMESLNIHNPFSEHDINSLTAHGKSPLFAALNEEIVALLAVSDPIKPTSKTAITLLHDMGIKTIMITGDQQTTAEIIAQHLNIDDVVANVLPSGKAEAIKAYQRYGVLAFVGDGINDAPALAQADVGIAIGNGAEIAVEAADVVLMKDDLSHIATTIKLSRTTMRIIKQNLFWAFAYNIILIPIAAGALYPHWHILLSPMLAAGAMALSSLFVLGNTLRLRRFQTF